MNDKMAIDAEVVDKFSDPIKRLRAQMQGLGRETKEHGKTIGEGFAHADRALAKTATTVTSVLNPALNSIGLTAIGVTAALAGIQAAVRNFTTNASGLGQLGRDTGIAAQQLRDVQSILGKVGVDAGASGSAIQNLAEKFRVARTGGGELMEFLRTQGKSAEGRKYFNDLADSIMRSKDNGEALTKALEGMEGIQDPAGRRKYAEQVLGLADAARLAEKHRGTIAEQLAKAGKEAGPLTPDMVASAEAYDKALSGLATTMKKIGTAIAMELEGPLAKVAVTMKSFLDDERKGVTPAVVQTIRDAVAYIESIDWNGAFARLREGFGEVKTELGNAFAQLRELMAEFSTKGSGDAVSGVFKEIGAAANDTARAIRAVALSIGVLKDLKNLDFSEAGKKLAEIDRATDAGIGKRSNAEPSKKLTPEAESMLGIITGGKPEDAAKAQREAEAMRREQGKLTDEMRRLREALPDKKPGEATVQQQSFDASTAPALGGLIQKASYGAAGAMARVGNTMAGIQSGGRGLTAQGDSHVMDRFRAFLENRGYTGGGLGRAPLVPQLAPNGPGDRVGRALRGEAPEDGRDFGDGGVRLYGGPGEGRGRFPEHTRDQMRESFRKYLMRKVPGYDGGPVVPPLVPGGPGDRIGRSLRGEPPETMPEDRGMLDLIAKAEGTTKRGYDDSFAHQLQGSLTDKSLGEIEQIQRGMRGSSAIGKYQFMRNTLFGSRGRPGLTDDLGISRDEKFTPELQDRLGNALIERRYKEAQRNHARSGGEFMSHFRTALAREWASFPGDYDQKGINGGMYAGQKASIGRERLTGAAQRWLDEREGRTAKPTPSGPRETADGAGWAARERARREFDASEKPAPNSTAAFAETVRKRRAESERQGYDFAGDGGRKLMERASRTPMLGGGGRGDVNGNVSVIVNKPGPDTKVSTSASGNLFRKVRMRRGNPMGPSDENERSWED